MPFVVARKIWIAVLLAGGTAAGAGQGDGGVPVQAVVTSTAEAFDGVVQALRQTEVTAQVAGAIVDLPVKAGDTVRAGQVLARLDARAAEQVAAAGGAQVLAAQASEEEARRELARQQRLFEKHYISEAALERAEARHATARAQAAAQRAAAGASRTQSGFYVVAAPYDAVVAEVPVALGDMALPGRPLLRLYDPRALRVSVNVPQRVAEALRPADVPMLTLPGDPAPVTPLAVRRLPVADPATHTVELHLELPPVSGQTVPGAFTRVWLPSAQRTARLYVPATAVVRRAELHAVYVLGVPGAPGRGDRPMLRQVRLGPVEGDRVEVLTGLAEGERVAADPVAAGRLR